MDTWWCPLIKKWQRYYFRYQVFIHGSIRSFCLQLTNNVYIFYSRFVCHIMLYIKGRWCNEIYQIIFEIKRIPIIWYFSRVNQIGHFGWDVGKIYKLKLKLKHFIGLPYTGFANTHANTKHWGKILKNKTKHTQLSTDRGQDIFQYSNDFLIVLFRELVTRIICEQSNIYLVEPCYI